MSTRCQIGLKLDDGKVEAIYCHHDGYPEYVGNVLVDNYKNKDIIKKLLSLGDLSSLGVKPISDPRLWEYNDEGDEDACKSYRDRGEKSVDARTYNSVANYITKGKEYVDYLYLFDDGQWKVFDCNDGNEFEPMNKSVNESLSDVEDKAREVVPPAYADAIRGMKKLDKKRKEMYKVKKTPKSSEEALADDVQVIEEALSDEEFTKDMKLRDAYIKYDSDEYQLDRIRDDITIEELWKEMKQGKDVYEIASVGGQGFDSAVREGLFNIISNALGIDYEVIYDTWLRPEKITLDESLFEDFYDEDEEAQNFLVTIYDGGDSDIKSGDEADIEAEFAELRDMDDEELEENELWGAALIYKDDEGIAHVEEITFVDGKREEVENIAKEYAQGPLDEGCSKK